jgi:phospholipid/cholesterol/gamma-HCH transport system substrate-binding protein
MDLKLATKNTRAILVALVVVALAVFGVLNLVQPDTKRGVAYFDSVTSVYKKDKIRILGVEVGRIEEVTAEDDKVRVEFSYDADYTLPADVQAAVVSPTLVATRFIQLEPAYSGGPEFGDGDVIPLERTASPLEFDDLKSELSRLSTALGPNGLDRTGALSDFLDVAAANGRGQGQRFNTMVTELSKSLETLAEGRGDIFGTVRNLQVFVTALASMDQRVAGFNRELANVSDLLDDNGNELTTAIRRVDRAAGLVRGFVTENRSGMTRATTQLGDLTTMLASSRDQLSAILHGGPNTLTNFFNIYSPRMRAFSGGLMVDNINTPGDLLCTLVAQAVQSSATGLAACASYLAPLLNQLGIAAPPIGTTGPLEVPGGGGPGPYGETEPAPYPEGPDSELPPSLNGDGLLGLMLPGGQR